MERILLWFYLPASAVALIAGGILLGIGHGSEALACGSLATGASLGAILLLLLKWRPNAQHKNDGHDT